MNKKNTRMEELSKLLQDYNIDVNTTNTTHFLLPMVLHNAQTGKALSVSHLRRFGFINAYLADMGEEFKDYDWYNSKNKYLYLLFSPKLTDNYLDREEQFKKFSNWVDYYSLDEDSTLTVHVFKIPKVFENDYDLFIKGKYSQMSERIKDIYSNRRILGIVNKEDWVHAKLEREYDIKIPDSQEYHSVIDLEKEVLRPEGIEINLTNDFTNNSI